nr:hypothetical protein [Candidatus Woesearchaeota archaeon]
MMWIKKKDPVCGKKQEKDGIEKHSKWFCSEKCLDDYEKEIERSRKKHGCCH